MACALPFAAQAALVQAQVQQGLELAAAWALKAGLLMVRPVFFASSPRQCQVK